MYLHFHGLFMTLTIATPTHRSTFSVTQMHVQLSLSTARHSCNVCTAQYDSAKHQHTSSHAICSITSATHQVQIMSWIALAVRMHAVVKPNGAITSLMMCTFAKQASLSILESGVRVLSLLFRTEFARTFGRVSCGTEDKHQANLVAAVCVWCSFMMA